MIAAAKVCAEFDIDLMDLKNWVRRNYLPECRGTRGQCTALTARNAALLALFAVIKSGGVRAKHAHFLARHALSTARADSEFFIVVNADCAGFLPKGATLHDAFAPNGNDCYESAHVINFKAIVDRVGTIAKGQPQ